MKVKTLQNLDPLNGDIIIEKIKQTIKKLKNTKAPGNDSITNEIIKCSDDIIDLMLVKFQNYSRKSLRQVIIRILGMWG